MEISTFGGVGLKINVRDTVFQELYCKSSGSLMFVSSRSSNLTFTAYNLLVRNIFQISPSDILAAFEFERDLSGGGNGNNKFSKQIKMQNIIFENVYGVTENYAIEFFDGSIDLQNITLD